MSSCVSVSVSEFWSAGPPGISTLRAPREEQADAQLRPALRMLRPLGPRKEQRVLNRSRLIPPTDRLGKRGQGWGYEQKQSKVLVLRGV